jgi:hypothetical protein
MNKIIFLLSVVLAIVPLCFGTTVSANNYTNEDVLLLARVINAEAGEGCEIEHNQLVGCVVMNRVADSRFPNTISGVIYQKGQYACINSKKFYQDPPKIAMDAAKYVLSGQAYCPKDVIFQSEAVQGEIYKTFYVNTKYYKSTTYFCRG